MTVSGVLARGGGEVDGLTDMTVVVVVLTPHHHTVALVTLQVPHHKLSVRHWNHGVGVTEISNFQIVSKIPPLASPVVVVFHFTS